MSEPGTHAFEVLSTEDKYVGRIIAVRLDQVAMPGGGKAGREVVEHLGAVAIVALDEEEQVTLIHQYRHPLARRIWELPAGLIDQAGEDPVETARRELVEEVGLAAGDWSVLVDVAVSPGFTDEAVRVYLATDLTTVDRVVEGDEEADLVARRFPLDEAVRMALAGEIVNGTAVAGLLAAKAVRTAALRPRPADAPWRDLPTRLPNRQAGEQGD
ncbi:NUDIX domain-containing protein [Actinophytocola xanthii]|uniref:ADP-ribose pyrophosphatase n=1 Tax=Actinophytocola xanthii TaxID=1912961 RepID=A0A1Q8CBT8_9PSEU|nr:NUDIX hydrolase [Actinophytocola xanthii]OLF11834.1 ADP-ribose pyrophosphatase [Actinophytocola xanthii]